MGDKKCLGFSVKTEIEMVFGPGSKLTLSIAAGRKCSVFSVSVEIDFVFVMGINLMSAWGIEIELVSV